MNFRAQLAEELKSHEGLRLKTYKDTTGHLTIGYGRNLEDNGISKEEAEMLLKNDIENAVNTAKKIFKASLFINFTENRQRAIVNMIFNLGEGSAVKRTGFLGFRNMVTAIQVGDWIVASQEALRSKWAKQVGPRAEYIASLLRDG